MKAKLILLDTPIIVSDEEIKAGDSVYDVEQKDIRILHDKRNETGFDKKILSHSKQIDYNGIDFGVVDVEKLAMDKLKSKWAHLYTFGYPEKPYPTNYENDLNLVKLGIYASQQLNEKKFSSEDMIEFAWEIFRDNIIQNNVRHKTDFIKVCKETLPTYSLHKTFEIEIEETDTHIKILKKL